MSSLLTVEDYNSVTANYINEYYSLDTRNISEQEFENVLYDFCIVSHSINGNNHTFTFEIRNTLWNGKYWFTRNDNTPMMEDAIFNDNIITFVTSENSVKLNLFLSNFGYTFSFKRLTEKLIELDPIIITKNQIGEDSDEIHLVDFFNRERQFTVPLGEGVIPIETTDYNLLVLLKKTDLVFDLNNDVTVGIINHVPLNVDRDYLPNGALVDRGLLDIIVYYNDLEIPVIYDVNLNDYCFDLDLTEKIDNKPVKLTVQVNEIDLVNPSTTEVRLNCNYSTAASFSELQTLIVKGAEIIELSDSILFDNNLIVPHDVYFIGNDNTINLGGYHVIISDKVNVKFEEGKFLNGESCFIQKPESILTLTDCDFVNAKITDNYKGSVVSSNNTSSITNLNNCNFLNCHHTIYTGSELNVSNCKALYNNWNDSLDTDYSAFINAFDGIITVTSSVFDIDYANKTITNEEINYALSLIGLSNECTFNNVVANQLDNNNVLPFTGNFYNNTSHVFAQFYHATVDDVVVASPVLGKEDQSVCHRIIGTDWIYKNNTQITRADRANTIRKINWEDI